MNGVIVNYRRGARTQTDNQMIILADGVDSKEKAEKLIKKTVVYKTTSGKELKGKITFVHGRKGAVRAIFETGMPGQALGQRVEIN